MPTGVTFLSSVDPSSSVRSRGVRARRSNGLQRWRPLGSIGPIGPLDPRLGTCAVLAVLVALGGPAVSTVHGQAPNESTPDGPAPRGEARSDLQRQDGVYGRLRGDVAWSATGGGSFRFDPDDASGGFLEMRGRYLDMAGLFVTLEELPSADMKARLSVGVDVRPLFLARLFTGGSFHRGFWDLWLDSLGLDLGVLLTPLTASMGVGTTAGLGMDIPLFSGWSVRVAARVARASSQYAPGPPQDVHDVGWMLGITYKGFVQSPLLR
jgi:hypothetical protein